MDNAAVSAVLDQVADLLEIGEANPFRIRAYRNAARVVAELPVPLVAMAAAGVPFTTLPSIGKEMASHVAELLATGGLAFRDQLAAEVPPSLLALVRLPGLGPKKAKALWKELGVATIEALEAAAREGRIARVPGFGKKTEERILRAIAEARDRPARLALDDAEAVVTRLLTHLRGVPGVRRLEAAGSFRRRRESVGDLDLLAVADDPEALSRRLREHPGLVEVTMAGETRTSVRLAPSLDVDLRIVREESFGAALVYFTGSKEHNVKLRQRAIAHGMRLSEYGLFRVVRGAEASAEEDPENPGERVAGATEEEVYAALGLPWIPPELREDRGEIEAAARGALPRLVTVADLRGDLQMHSTWSDGRVTIEEMVAACAARGYGYMALTDHSKSLPVVQGLDAARLQHQWREIDEVRARHPEIVLLRSLEIDILGDGTLDLEDEMLRQLDLGVVSVHSRFDLPEPEQTARLLRAVKHPGVHVLAHPTGRKVLSRRGIEVDMGRVLDACAEHGVAVELNASPDRLDLREAHLVMARERGVPVVVSTDAHHPRELDFMRWGIDQARRAWLEPRHVLNTREWPEFERWIHDR